MNFPVLESNGLITTLKIMVGHRCTNADMSTRQVHTLQLQLQPQRLYFYRLTPVKCPPLLSHERTGQVDSSALDLFLSSPHVVSYPAVVTSCSTEFFFCLGRMGCDTVFALPATLSTSSSLDSNPTNGRRINLQPILLVATRPTLYMKRLAPHSTLDCPQPHASSSHR